MDVDETKTCTGHVPTHELMAILRQRLRLTDNPQQEGLDANLALELASMLISRTRVEQFGQDYLLVQDQFRYEADKAIKGRPLYPE